MAYRGKYPARVNAIGSVKGLNGVRVILNDGRMFDVSPKAHTAANMPRLGAELAELQSDATVTVTPFDPAKIAATVVSATLSKIAIDYESSVTLSEGEGFTVEFDAAQAPVKMFVGALGASVETTYDVNVPATLSQKNRIQTALSAQLRDIHDRQQGLKKPVVNPDAVHAIQGRSIDGVVYWDGRDGWSTSMGDAHPIMTIAEAQAQMDRLVDVFTAHRAPDEKVGRIGWIKTTRGEIQAAHDRDMADAMVDEAHGPSVVEEVNALLSMFDFATIRDALDAAEFEEKNRQLEG